MTIKYAQLNLNNLEVVTNTPIPKVPESNEMILGHGKEIKIKGNRVGHLDQGIFIADRQVKRKFRLHNGWGLSKLLLQELEGIHAKNILFRIKDETDLVYTLEVSPSNWIRKGIDYFNPALQEVQLILPETSFDKKVFSNVRVIR
jgi:hypothetical protein